MKGISEKDKYYVQFTYDGIEYTSYKVNLDNDNGSKAKEVKADRENLNNQFELVDYQKTLDARNGNINRDVIATTDAAGCKFEKLNSNTENYTIENINLGLIEREKAEIELTEVLKSATVVVNGYEHTYNYLTYQKDEKASSMKVEFKNKELGIFTREIYPSDIALASTDSKKLAVYATYRITLNNNSTTLNAEVRQLI